MSLEERILPEKIFKLLKITQKKNKHRAEVENLLGRPDYQQKDSSYYTFHKFKYALSLHYKNHKLDSFTYVLRSNKFFFSRLSRIKRFEVKGLEMKDAHQRGKFLVAKNKKSPFSYVFKNTSKRPLYSLKWIRE